MIKYMMIGKSIIIIRMGGLNMVHFDKNHFNITIEGDVSNYMGTIEVILKAIESPTESHADERFYLCNLLRALLPNGKQIVNIEDAEYLKQVKNENNKKVSFFEKS